MIKLLLTSITTMIVIVSCNSPQTQHIDSGNSYELSLITGDTVNRIDAYGHKQGKWYIREKSTITDTVYYKNDSIIK